MKRCVIVGYGGMGSWHARHIMERGAVELAGIYDIKEERVALAREKGIYAYPSLEAVLADESVELITIATPNELHKPLAIAALRAGKHVLCEKPIAVCAGELERVQVLAAERNLFLMEAMWTRFLPVMSAIKKVIADGVIGDVMEVSADFCYNNPDHTHHAFAGGGDGGSVLDVGIYGLNFALMFLGEDVQRVQATAIMENNADLCMNALLTFERGKVARVSSALALDKPADGYIYGSKGYIFVPHFYGASQFDVVVGGNTTTHTVPFKGNGFEEEIQECCRCILAGKTQSDTMPLARSMVVMKLMDEIRGQLGIVHKAN